MFSKCVTLSFLILYSLVIIVIIAILCVLVIFSIILSVLRIFIFYFTVSHSCLFHLILMSSLFSVLFVPVSSWSLFMSRSVNILSLMYTSKIPSYWSAAISSLCVLFYYFFWNGKLCQCVSLYTSS